MKINEALQSQQITATKQGVGTAAAGIDFQRLLAGELQKALAGQPVQEAAGVVAAPQAAPAVRLEGLAATEETIGTLDAFAGALEDRRFSAEALEPFVSALEENTVSLLAVKNQLPAADPLASVLERVATVAYLESAKYRRGDYSA
ncbi:MAG: hypothetical protein M0017_01815 [Desulfobacteraceae bacterium]|nr:hypothetical protein [Desulfobacteraceae bacterium]